MNTNDFNLVNNGLFKIKFTIPFIDKKHHKQTELKFQ
jgi:hypothetical protein